MIYFPHFVPYISTTYKNENVEIQKKEYTREETIFATSFCIILALITVILWTHIFITIKNQLK